MSERGPAADELRPVTSTDFDGIAQADLARRIGAGDKDAERELVHRFRAGLVSLLRFWTGETALSEDIAHDAIVVTLERLRARPLEDPSKLVAFMRGTARNLLTASTRREVRRRTLSAGDQIYRIADERFDAATIVERSQESDLVRRLIADLAVTRDREMLLRHYIHGEPKSQICADLSLDATHFDRVLHRARVRLREMLKRRLGGQ